jgi:hypothetical protein
MAVSHFLFLWPQGGGGLRETLETSSWMALHSKVVANLAGKLL